MNISDGDDLMKWLTRQQNQGPQIDEQYWAQDN